ncbi:metallophosphoesterase family protein [Candidatus Pollutiaquabacter sp.]|uniref:metallophosphoesterase family protein n=1 Tax=Candidatus Pollutiaquabacter sp. TaxID=3416354 RepID=UPI003C998143|nr:metallophosphoesterase [Bacteroidota bacterium]
MSTFARLFRRFCLCLALLFQYGCEQFEYSPYQTKHPASELRDLNASNRAKLQASSPRDTIVLVISGDQQRFYDEVDDMVTDINRLEQVDAVFLVGDLTDFGLIREFGWLNESLLRLKCPFFGVIGNHDCVANGTEIFERTYGPLNEYFDWAGIRLVLHNTNSREFSFNGRVPDLGWLRNAVADTAAYEACIFLSHVEPFNAIDFDPSLEAGYVQLLDDARVTLFSAHGHDHIAHTGSPYGDGLTFFNAGSPAYRSYTLAKIYKRADGSLDHILSVRPF